MRTNELAAVVPESEQALFPGSPVWTTSPVLQWPALILDPESVRAGISMLPRHAREALAAMMLRFGAAPVEEEKLVAETIRLTPLSGAEARDGFYRLQTAGIVFAVRKAWGERHLFVPRDAFAIWQRELFPCPIVPFEDFRPVRLDGPAKFCRTLGRQLLAAYAELARCGLGLTVKGTPAAKTLQKLERALDADSVAFAKLGGAFAPQAPYTPASAFVLDTALRLGLISAGGGKSWTWRFDALRRWLSQQRGQREQWLHRSIAERYAYADRLTAHAASALEGLKPRRWYSAEAMLRWLQSLFRNDCAETEADRKRLGTWIDALCAFGWMQRGIADNGESCFRWTEALCGHEPGGRAARLSRAAADIDIDTGDDPAGCADDEPDEALIVLDDGELLAPPSIDFGVLWRLELFADRVSEDVIAVYRMTRKSVIRGLAGGWTASDAERFLEWASGSSLPPVVRALLAEWSGAQQRAVRSGTLYPFANTTGSLLDDMQPFTDLSEEICIADETGLVPDPLSLRGFAWTAPRPPLEVLARQVEQLPVIWLQQFRSYHHSTRRELLERALSIQAPVQLKLAGRITEFVPQQVLQRDEEWTVKGFIREKGVKEPVTLLPEMWEEMKLLLPLRQES
ncbi:helicase-associated domain-containing protein [Paenibacillus beijingensis]|uniref:Helicase XPB/Ssl2 N-terminal domain-containing protein n=1 Tax=Paenibacillus beijingensis TaxID=1126833 RepID=A0A0D5NNE1_9BACL|nr:helicase-associated domain-containing protein [Paenibacillus beijingensis]AJY76443.1 hypothetical protein VN24_20045 [Paenibacillus beijingensis]